MSWHFSQALVAEYLEATCLDGDAFAPSNGNPIPQAYLSPDRMKAFSRLSRFGMTCEPLTEDHGAAVLMWYLEGFPVRTYPQQEREQESTGSDPGCGKKWHGSLAKYDRDTCSWRTAQYSLLGDLELFSETWPRWGMMRNGECSERTISAELSNVKGFGYWPAPVKTDGFAGFSMGTMERKELGETRPSGAKIGTCLKWDRRALPYVQKGKINPILHDWLMMFPLGWTALDVPAMHSFQRWCALHGIPYTKD
jgi:hypothetical protein